MQGSSFRLLRAHLMFAVLVAFSAVGVLGQGTGTAPPGGGGGGGAGGGGNTPAPGTGTTGRTGTLPQATSTTGNQPDFESLQRPMFVAGRVMMDDGTAPPMQVTIVKYCGGVTRPLGYTDSKGNFTVSLSGNRNVMPDASVSSVNDPSISPNTVRSAATTNGPNKESLSGCELHADLSGYRSDVVELGQRRSMDNPNVGTIMLHRLSTVQGFTYSLTSAKAPKEAQKAYEKAVEVARKQKYDEAEISFRKAVEIYPDYSLAWYDLGRVLQLQKKLDDAKTAYEKAYAVDPKYINPQIQLLMFAVDKREWQEMLTISDRILKLNPFEYSNVWFINGAAKYSLNDLEGAEKSAREALRLDPNHKNARINHLLASILSDKGQYAEAIVKMNEYLAYAPGAADADAVKKQVGQWEKMQSSDSAQAPKAEEPPKN